MLICLMGKIVWVHRRYLSPYILYYTYHHALWFQDLNSYLDLNQKESLWCRHRTMQWISHYDSKD